jgi:methylated-DNA-protein-cysteine methyltransferase related protein
MNSPRAKTPVVPRPSPRRRPSTGSGSPRIHSQKAKRPHPSSPQNLFIRIYALVRNIPRGQVATYGQIARALGMPRGARTVGWAMHDCPDDVPWHRVINAQGQISARPTLGYQTQHARLKSEGVRFDRAGRIDLVRFGWKKI